MKYREPVAVQGCHVALYGNVAILRGYCPECCGTALIIDGKFMCCDSPVEGAEPKKIKRIIEPEFYRNYISKAKRKAIMQAQDYSCFWCSRRFRSFSKRINGKPGVEKLRVHWDHVVPFIYSQNNSIGNIVASCHQCNLLKGAMIFESYEKAQVYLTGELRRRGVLSAEYVFDQGDGLQ